MATSSITPDLTVVRCEQLVTADMDEDLVMMSLATNNYYSLDPIGKRIWMLLEEPIQVAELCNRLTAEFEVESSQCLEDLLGFLNDLKNEGLLQCAR